MFVKQCEIYKNATNYEDLINYVDFCVPYQIARENLHYLFDGHGVTTDILFEYVLLKYSENIIFFLKVFFCLG